MAKIRCKMFVNHIAPAEHEPDKVDVHLTAVYDGSDENKAFWEATPSGSLTFSTVNKAAVEGIEVGQEFYVDLTPA